MAILARKNWNALFFLGFVGISLCRQVQAEERPLQLQEQKIKAGLTYNFIKYTEWPSTTMPSTTSAIVACIFGEDPFDGYLQPMEERTVKQKNIRIREVTSIPETAGCHLVLIGSQEKAHWPQLRHFLANKSVLTVGDFPGFVEDGGMIQFGKKSGHIYMELNVEAISAAHLRIYDTLLQMSKAMNSSQTRRGQ